MIVFLPYPKPKEPGPELWPDPNLDDPSKYSLTGNPSSGSNTLAGGFWTVTAWNGSGIGNMPRLSLSNAENAVLDAKTVNNASYTVTIVTTATTGIGGITLSLRGIGTSIVPANSPAGTYTTTVVAGSNPGSTNSLTTGRNPGNTQVTSISLKQLV